MEPSYDAHARTPHGLTHTGEPLAKAVFSTFRDAERGGIVMLAIVGLCGVMLLLPGHYVMPLALGMALPVLAHRGRMRAAYRCVGNPTQALHHRAEMWSVGTTAVYLVCAPLVGSLLVVQIAELLAGVA